MTTEARTDLNITNDKTVTAIFIQLTEHTLIYLAETGGSIDGQNIQVVADSTDGTQVTAVPSTGYTFVK